MLADARRQIAPATGAIRGREIIGSYFAGFHPRNKSAPPTQAQRSRNHQQIASRRFAEANRSAAVAGLRRARIIGAPIQRVDGSSLAGTSAGRHRKVGVAAEPAEQGDFVVESTPSSARKRVVERPVAVNEAEAHATVALPQQPVPVREELAEPTDSVYEILAALAIMMDVYLDIRDPIVGHLSECIEYFGMILLRRIEERVLGRTVRRICSYGSCDFRPAPSPRI